MGRFVSAFAFDIQPLLPDIRPLLPLQLFAVPLAPSSDCPRERDLPCWTHRRCAYMLRV
jgi:hypothetical protein